MMLDCTVGGGSLTSCSPVGRTGTCGHLRTLTRLERSKGGCGVPGAHLPKARLEIAAHRGVSRSAPFRVLSLRFNRICSSLFKRRGMLAARGCVITSRRELGSPRGRCGMMAGAEAPKPQKRYYRQRAHSNPMADHTLH